MTALFHDLAVWVVAWAHTPHASAALAVLAFVESSFFPIPPDVLLISLALIQPHQSFGYALICTAFSVLGGMFGYAIGRYGGRPILERFMSTAKIQVVERYYQRYDVWAVGMAGFTPIPYKVFTISAGTFLLDFKRFIVASALGRGGRFFLVAGLFYFFGQPIGEFVKKSLNTLSVAFAVLLVGGFAVIHWWSTRHGHGAAPPNADHTEKP